MKVVGWQGRAECCTPACRLRWVVLSMKSPCEVSRVGWVNWKLALKGCALCCVRCLLLFLPAGDFRCMSVSARQAPCILLCF